MAIEGQEVTTGIEVVKFGGQRLTAEQRGLEIGPLLVAKAGISFDDPRYGEFLYLAVLSAQESPLKLLPVGEIQSVGITGSEGTHERLSEAPVDRRLRLDIENAQRAIGSLSLPADKASILDDVRQRMGESLTGYPGIVNAWLTSPLASLEGMSPVGIIGGDDSEMLSRLQAIVSEAEQRRKGAKPRVYLP